jgi:hypothetical protein
LTGIAAASIDGCDLADERPTHFVVDRSPTTKGGTERYRFAEVAGFRFNASLNAFVFMFLSYFCCVTLFLRTELRSPYSGQTSKAKYRNMVVR